MKIIVLILGLFACTLQASQEQTFKEQVQWAKSEASTALNPSSIPLDVNDYCKDATCRQQVANPKEAGLSDAEINAKKGAAYANNDMAQSITHNFNQGRPDVKNDPTMQFALLGQENAFEVSHGISNAYVDCTSGTQCNIDFTPKRCNQATGTSVPCEKIPIAKVVTDSVNYICSEGTLKGHSCEIPTEECRYESFYGQTKYGVQVSTHGGAFIFWENNRYQLKSLNWEYYDNHYLKPGPGKQACKLIHITVPATLTCNEGSSLSGGNCIKNTFTWSTQCHLIKECHPISETCIEGEETRDINGIPTTLSCWKYQVLHACDINDSCKNFPKDCEEQSRTCSLKQNGVCVEQEVSMKCPEKTCRATQMQCGEQSFCLDGDCYEATPTLNDEFDQSAAALAGLAAAAEGLGNPPKIFTGNAMKCDIKLAGFNDCCKDSGWGQGLGAGCSDGEKALGDAKEKGLTIYVGKYCAKKVLGACTRKKKSYCVFDSKLAKIIQQQGVIGQLGKSLGSAKSPTCNPITPEELSAIDFEYIDFQEFYPDMTEGMELPDFDEIKDRLESANGG